MHIPPKWEMDSQNTIYEFIQSFSFATIVSEALEGAHIPLLLNAQEGEKGTLYGHFSRANPCHSIMNGHPVLAIFQGPHAYISPSWYMTRPAVPTWNYASVHVKGILKLTEDQETIQILRAMVEKYEPALNESNDILTDEIVNQLLRGIVGFKIEIDELQGKEKLGQHRTTEDQIGVFNQLVQSSNLEDMLLANYLKQRKLDLK